MPRGLEGFRTRWYYSALLAGLLAAAFLVRFYFATQLLPAPVGDSFTFLEPIYNYCHSGKLTSYFFNIDPTGEHRFIWQGPLPPIVYRLLGRNCNLQGLFELRIVFFLIIPFALAILFRRKLLSLGAWFCLSVFCLATAEKVGFRPEYLCMILVVLAYVARISDRVFLEGICWACLFLSSPVSGGLYGVVRAVDTGSAGLKEIPGFLIGAIPTLAVVFSLYPYHLGDWLVGIELQGQFINGRSDGDIFTYYIRSDFLPLWGFSLALMMAIGVFLNLRYLLLLPFVWYFGFRVPTTSYNLLTTVTLIFLQAYPLMSRRLRGVAAVFLLVPGLLGLVQISARDAVSIVLYHDSFNQTRATIGDLVARGARITEAPFFTFLSNPEIYDLSGKGFPVIASPHSEGGTAPSDAILISQDSGSGAKTCPQGTTSMNAPPQRPWWLLFNSSSSWAINRCKHAPAPLSRGTSDGIGIARSLDGSPGEIDAGRAR